MSLWCPLYVLSLDTSFGQAGSCITKPEIRLTDVIVRDMEVTMATKHKMEACICSLNVGRSDRGRCRIEEPTMLPNSSEHLPPS